MVLSLKQCDIFRASIKNKNLALELAKSNYGPGLLKIDPRVQNIIHNISTLEVNYRRLKLSEYILKTVFSSSVQLLSSIVKDYSNIRLNNST